MRIDGCGRAAQLDRGRARHHLPRADPGAVRPRVPHRQGGGPRMIVFEILAAVLAVAAVVYLVVALVAPERF
ncbi:protein of unknown function [Microbacterium sp. Nx66]|nr:protein of unknown function [Microbacterium sp. Nx66]